MGNLYPHPAHDFSNAGIKASLRTTSYLIHRQIAMQINKTQQKRKCVLKFICYYNISKRACKHDFARRGAA
jgi:hypothetical protein